MPETEAYLDANAGMPLRPEAREALLRALDLLPGNPSSAHAAGRRVRKVLSEAREQVAALVGAEPQEVVFTSGGTEANVLALRGALAAAARPALVTTRAEHTSILRLADRLETEGVRVERIGVDRSARVDAARFVEAAAEAGVASLGLAQSVTGTIQRVGDVARGLAGRGVVLHTDGAQAAGRVPVDVRALGVDLLSLAAAKIGGPPGAGALVIRKGTAWTPPHGAGSQELGRRPGTEAVPLVAAFGAAAAAASRDAAAFAARARVLTQRVREFVREFPGGEVITPDEDALPNTVLVAFAGCPGDAVLAALDARGVRVGTGTACTSLARTPPEVLLAGGRDAAESARAVRVSVAWSTAEGDVARLLAALADLLPRVRSALTTS